jgi:predicted nucleic acid-binding protein
MARPASAERRARPLYVAEPAPRYDQRPPAVVDASLVCALLFAEPEQVVAAERLSICRPVAPALLPYELANVAVNKLRRGGTEAAVRAGLADFDGMGIELRAVEAPVAFDLAARYTLTAYDAAYLALAVALQAPLLTFDKKLADAARHALGAKE